jgi:hypothetical protein
MEKPSSAGIRGTILIYLIMNLTCGWSRRRSACLETDGRISYCDCHGTPKFISRRWAIHTEPCPSCPDHPNTKYPDARKYHDGLEAVAHGGSLGFTAWLDRATTSSWSWRAHLPQ